jgi:hypothetical protein
LTEQGKGFIFIPFLGDSYKNQKLNIVVLVKLKKIFWLIYYTPPPLLYALLRSKQLFFRPKEKILKSSFDILDAKEWSKPPSDATVPLTALGSLLRGCAGAAPSTSVMLLLMMSLGLSWCCWHAPLLSQQQQQNLPIQGWKCTAHCSLKVLSENGNKSIKGIPCEVRGMYVQVSC